MFPQFKRNQYYYGKLMSVQDFQAEQDYYLEKHRLHNRLLHGFGVVAGLEVSISDDPPGCVRVEAGYAIDRLGNDLILSQPQLVPFPERGKKACLVIEYAERETDGVPASSEGESDVTVGSRVEEYAVLRTAMAKQGEDAGGGDVITLAQLKKRGGVWRLDQRFEARRVAVAS